MAQRKPRVYASAWKRGLAFVLDALLVTKVAWPLLVWGLPVLAALSPWGKYVLGALYFGCFDSFFFGGATLGKRLLAIQVRGDDRKLLRPTQAVGRFLVFASPAVAASMLGSFWADAGGASAHLTGNISFVFMACLLVGCWIAGSVFLIFHPQKRSLHDILSETVVVTPDGFFDPPTGLEYRPMIAAVLVYVLVAWQGWMWGNHIPAVGIEYFTGPAAPAKTQVMRPRMASGGHR